MVKILKTPLPKHEETLSPVIKNFVLAASSTPLLLLPQLLDTFPSRWPFPRDDLYHWIPLLNRFDAILEDFCKVYGLQNGPQTRDFTCEILERDNGGALSLKALGYEDDGDRQMLESILYFSRLLLENCGNRTIYASSPLLSDLLNSTSLSLVAATLQIGTQLAQRYQASFKRLSGAYRPHSSTLLAIHYNINLDRVQQLAQPFMRTTLSTDSHVPSTPITPSSKGKDKAVSTSQASNRTSVSTVYANDLVTLATTEPLSSDGLNGQKSSSTSQNSANPGQDWGDVRVTYYETESRKEQEPVGSGSSAILPSLPSTPTPIRRASTLGQQHGQRSNRLSNSEDSTTATARIATTSVEDGSGSKPKIVAITAAQIASSSIHQLLEENMTNLPMDSKYELLNKLRVAKALACSVEQRRLMLAVRILAVTNLAYIHAEATFLEKVLKQDMDEPRRLQLVYQLADMIHPPVEGKDGIPISLQTIALAGLDALAGYQAKTQDVCVALNTNVNHGVLLYIVKKAVAEMAVDEKGDKISTKDEWRQAVFSLLSHVAILPRAGPDMVAAGLVPILMDVLKCRTSVAERNYPMILDFLDAFIFNVRDAFQILVGADGLETLSDLIIHQVGIASEVERTSNCMRPEYRSPAIDYEIPFFLQHSMKWLFKFIHHMMSTAGGYGGNFDRLLRNLIDSAQLLGSLRDIISNAQRFGSTVWTNAVRILNDFINNEPTSFTVIAEAGLSRAVLEAVTGREIKMVEEVKEATSQSQPEAANDDDSPAHTDDDDSFISTVVVDDTPHPPSAEMLEAPRDGPLARGILASSEAITIIPSSFSAICLNTSGMRMFQASNALQSFFEVFESPKHVQCMDNDINLPSNLGATFDELVRHHPSLKMAVLNATLDMVARVAHMCRKMASTDSSDAKLWMLDENGQMIQAEQLLQSNSSKGKGKAASSDMDDAMSGVVEEINEQEDAAPEAAKSAYANPSPYVFVVATFLSAMFTNSSVRIAFMEMGGSEYVLNLAELPSLPYDFADQKASSTIHSAICTLAEQKPHIILPSLLKRAQAAIDTLAPFIQHQGDRPYFAPFFADDVVSIDNEEVADRIANGTRMAKALVNIHSLTTALNHYFQSVYSHRSSVNAFNMINVTDYYIQFVKSMGPLLAAAIKEEFAMKRMDFVPAHWRKATRTKNSERFLINNMINEFIEETVAASNAHGISGAEDDANPAPGTTQPVTQPVEKGGHPDSQILSKKERENPRFRNFKTLRYLLTKLPPVISAFCQGLGRVLIIKRYPEAYQRQSNASIAEAIADAVLLQLPLSDNDATLENYNFWIIMLETVKDILVNASRSAERTFECITLVLQAFKERGGFETLNRLLSLFAEEIGNFKKTEQPTMLAGQKCNLATIGAKHILTLYLLLVNGKNIMESPQTSAMIARSERDRARQDAFSTRQFLVEIRMAILPPVRRLWESDFVEKAPDMIPHVLIDIIRVVAVADLESGAFKRSDKPPVQSKPARKPWKVNPDNVAKLIEAEFPEDLAKEALFRCNNNYSLAFEYCNAQRAGRSGARNPVPLDELEPTPDANGISSGHTEKSTGSSTPVVPDPPVMQLDEPAPEAATDAAQPEQVMAPPAVPGDLVTMGLGTFINRIGRHMEAASAADQAGAIEAPTPSLGEPSASATVESQGHAVTVDDLDDERAAIQAQLIERCLDVINAHGEVTFEIAELIKTVVDKSPDPPSLRKDIGETIVQALMSFAFQDDIREVGRKVAAYAHLLALMLQNGEFYAASVADLSENLPTLLGFITLSASHSFEEPSPWIAHILLIVETLLNNDAQPPETVWKYPSLDNPEVEGPVLKLAEPVVSSEMRDILFGNILEILPRVGKDESLALAVLRVLVILTRSRKIALATGEKKNIQRLFVMAKQLAGSPSVQHQAPLMIILRHIIEDDETVKQTMRSEIKTFFENQRSQRPVEAGNYIRQLSHLVLRAPGLFIAVTNEMVKLNKWSPGAHEAPSRQQIIIHERYEPLNRIVVEESVLPPLPSTGSLSIQDVKPTTEAVEGLTEEGTKPPNADLKTPVVENPDGVIHFLLCELLNYKDVEDKDSTSQPIERIKFDVTGGAPDSTTAEAGSASTPPAATDGKDSKKHAKPEFKLEEHPIYLYRCFLLQCLTELLSSYNRTKLEFINFKRNAPPQAITTPSRPRSSVVNYMLCDLIPIGTLEHVETTSSRKKMVTSMCADSVLTALLSKTGEQVPDRSRDAANLDEEPDLLFVRKFVLENILKAYKDASISMEPLDIKYARMLSLADLMTHIMAAQEAYPNAGESAVAKRSRLQLQRTMFDKGFIAALTGSIADIDLNFPGAKRAVKHILRPLRTLTQTAIELSDAGKITLPPGHAEEDDIASTSSVSELDEEREDTPDLFRNSTLGMFEPRGEEESSSGSEDDDEEMYEGGFEDEEMEFEEEIMDDEEDNISDEEEELEGIGQIEGLSGNHAVNVEVIMGEDEDDDEDDDDDDDDNDDDEPSDEDDEDSDDIVDEDDLERIEIVDEDGNAHPLEGGVDGDGWQSEDEEVEGAYEGRDDGGEEHNHEISHLARGAIGHLVRALGGEDHDGAVEILQRIENEGIDEASQLELEGYLQDEQDEDEEEEDEEDMEDEEAIYDEYPVAPPGMSFEWEGEVSGPPLPMIIGHRGHHRPRHGLSSPFGYFPTGVRDSLGGMLHPLPELEEFLDMEHLATTGLDRAQRALSVAENEAGLESALSTARSALQSARTRLTELQAHVSRVLALPGNVATNSPSVPDAFTPYRSHRPGPAPRVADDGQNPLLQRPLTGIQARDTSYIRQLTSSLGPPRPGDGPSGFSHSGPGGLGEGPAALLNELITSLPLPGPIVSRHGHASLHFHVGGRHEMARDLQALFGMTRGPPRYERHREHPLEPGTAVGFHVVRSTALRWIDEAKMIFGAGHADKAYSRMLLAVMACLIPPAFRSEIEARKVAEELKKKHEEEEKVIREAREKKEAEERAAKEKQEAEEREAAERARAEEEAAIGDGTAVEVGAEESTDAATTQPMEGVETTEEEAPPPPAEEVTPTADRPRITTVIRGNQIDITDLGIDPAYLDALPEEFREEVVTNAISERRSRAVESGAEPSEIDQDFLDALPSEIRDEIIAQERLDRRRRERETQRREAIANGAASAPVPQEMDAASILASFTPALRQQVLMEQDDDVLAALPPEFIAQARAGIRDLPLGHVRNMPAGRPRPINHLGEQALQKPPRRTIVQMLDKAGVATLLRLMFVYQEDNLRATLLAVLQNIVENRHNRSEVVSTILHILQDGSIDMTAVERSFAHLSLRAKQPKDKDPKTPQPLKRSLTGISLTTTNMNIISNTDVSPLMVVQQCLFALNHLTSRNGHVINFFLQEHDSAGGLKRSASRKGKGKETKASKYALNALFILLDRKLIMESSSVMDSLSELLARVTNPLQALEKKQREAAEEAKRARVAMLTAMLITNPPASVASPETTTTNEQPVESMDTDQDPPAAPTPATPVPGASAITEIAATPLTVETATDPVPIAEQSEKPVPTDAKETEQKKQRAMLPPVIPDEHLKLVINIFVARECSGKTFRETLSTIKNLSCIPGAKAVFGRELIFKAQELGEMILKDLDDLLPQIQKASNGTEVQGVALAKFSPPGSDQNKLLRVLTAVDHLFDPKVSPKRDAPDSTNSEAEGESSREVEKQDLLATLYKNSTFGPMWEKLSACLGAIRQRDNMLNVATILLPLIESLMVVCKNTQLREASHARSQIVKDLNITSPPPEPRIESLFFSFTEEHRKILNDLVRHTPKLMSGTFALLVKNPKVLEFDNKRNYFTRSIHNRNHQPRQSYPPLQLSLRRDQVFHDSYRSLYYKNADEMKYGKLSIRFHGEEGVDAGGVTREWFQVLSRQMFDPGYALFVPVSSDRTTFHPNHMSSINPEHLSFFKFIGRVIGKALYEGRVLDCHFSRAVYKRILGKAVSIKDMESLDPEYYKSVVWMVENDITDIITETFSVDNDKFGVVETIDLVENGRNVPVTEDNKQDYIRLMVEFKLTGSVKEQLDNFLEGFHEIIPAELVAIFNEQELELLISGLPEVDVDDWKRNTEYHNYTGSSPQIQWFWRAMRSFDKEERAKLLQFVTGTSKVPLNGFKELEGMNGFSRFNIHRDYGAKDRLPSSHTCFNQLDLPEYESYETLRQQILLAITAGSDYFGFA